MKYLMQAATNILETSPNNSTNIPQFSFPKGVVPSAVRISLYTHALCTIPMREMKSTWSEKKHIEGFLSLVFDCAGVRGCSSADKSVTVAGSWLISGCLFLSMCRLKQQQHRISTACLSLTFLFLSADKSAWNRALSFESYCLIYFSFNAFLSAMLSVSLCLCMPSVSADEGTCLRGTV